MREKKSSRGKLKDDGRGDEFYGEEKWKASTCKYCGKIFKDRMEKGKHLVTKHLKKVRDERKQ